MGFPVNEVDYSRKIRITVSKYAPVLSSEVIWVTDQEKTAGNVATSGAQPGSALWRRVPTRDPDGQLYNDCLFMLPGLKAGDAAHKRWVRSEIQAVCQTFADQVVFAELNEQVQTLWITIPVQPGLAGQLLAALRARLPHLLIVGDYGQGKTMAAKVDHQQPNSGSRRGLGRMGRRQLDKPA